jgi:cytochrome c oxidase subunit 2
MYRHVSALLAALFLVSAHGTRGPARPAPVPAGARADEKEKEARQAFEGRKLFLKLQCIKCHTAGPNAKAPNLEGLFGTKVKLEGDKVVTADEGYIVESIRKPREKVVEGWIPLMPAYDQKMVSDEEVKQLVAYLKSLKPGDVKGKGEPAPPRK